VESFAKYKHISTYLADQILVKVPTASLAI